MLSLLLTHTLILNNSRTQIITAHAFAEVLDLLDFSLPCDGFWWSSILLYNSRFELALIRGKDGVEVDVNISIRIKWNRQCKWIELCQTEINLNLILKLSHCSIHTIISIAYSIIISISTWSLDAVACILVAQVGDLLAPSDVPSAPPTAFTLAPTFWPSINPSTVHSILAPTPMPFDSCWLAVFYSNSVPFMAAIGHSKGKYHHHRPEVLTNSTFSPSTVLSDTPSLAPTSKPSVTDIDKSLLSDIALDK